MSLATLLVIFVLIPIIVAIAAIPELRGALPRVVRQRAFIGAAAVLALAAVGLNAATESMRLHFKKQAVDLSVPRLDDAEKGIPSKLGPWVQVSKDEPLDHAIQEVLGTKEFVFRDYVDSRLVSQNDIDWFKDKTHVERGHKIAEIQALHPEAVVRFAVTYYTGLVDTVPHVPEKCYVADGFDFATPPETRTETFGAYGDQRPRELSVRYIHFQDSTASSRVDRDVAYVFHVNGRYESSSIGVRKELQDLRQRYGYFAKVEVMTTARSRANDTAEVKAAAQAKSLAAFKDLLTHALPEVERCLPDWKKVTAAK